MTKKICLIATLLSFSITNINAAPADITIQNDVYSARDKVMPALVHIQPVLKNYNAGEMEKQAVIGSGIIFHPDGYVVTNFHVAGKSERIICTLYDKEIVTAEFIGGDPMTDLAVIKLNLEKYNGKIAVAEFGNSDAVEVGQYVMAMGSPLALSRSVSLGVVSTKDRYFSSDVRLPSGERTGRYNLWIQTDAAINPGNSGGPLVDLQGSIVGINSRAMMFANNIGFAIPVNIVKNVIAEILDHNKVIRSWIGLHCQALQELEDYFKTDRNTGVLISSIDIDSPADNSSLKAGDVILEVNNQSVSARFLEELPKFYSTIAKYPPGTDLSLKVLRGDETFDIKVKTKQLGELQGEDFDCVEWGFTVKEITTQMQIDNQLENSDGVFVTGVKNVGLGGNGGLRRGDVIIKINNIDISQLSSFKVEYENQVNSKSEKVLLTVRRNSSIRFVLLVNEDKDGDKINE
jgi:serine protease Do